MLLVGGASTRFGAPKALAQWRGETLAEHAWGLLEWCSERLAVGKAGDDLPLPFPVLDDARDERAAIHGVIAGLAAARHDVCIVLPVDCPLVTERSLHALADAVAVAQTGPLPGAYDKSMLPELEARAARGELSLRGVNSRVLTVDVHELANVNRPTDLADLA